MTTELQRAQDLLTAMQGQRDNALNANVHMQAELLAAQRRIGELMAEKTLLETQLSEAKSEQPASD